MQEKEDLLVRRPYSEHDRDHRAPENIGSPPPPVPLATLVCENSATETAGCTAALSLRRAAGRHSCTLHAELRFVGRSRESRVSPPSRHNVHEVCLGALRRHVDATYIAQHARALRSPNALALGSVPPHEDELSMGAEGPPRINEAQGLRPRHLWQRRLEPCYAPYSTMAQSVSNSDHYRHSTFKSAASPGVQYCLPAASVGGGSVAERHRGCAKPDRFSCTTNGASPTASDLDEIAQARLNSGVKTLPPQRGTWCHTKPVGSCRPPLLRPMAPVSQPDRPTPLSTGSLMIPSPIRHDKQPTHFVDSLGRHRIPPSARRRDTGERPWVCGSCPKGFARSDILKRHAMICRKLREKPHGIASLSHPQAHITTSPQAQVTQTSTVSRLASEPGIYQPISQGKVVAPSADARPRKSAVVGVQKEPPYAGNPGLAGNDAPDTWSTAFNDMGYSQQDGADAPELMHLQQLLNEGVINELKERSGW
ncbi:hypothetical protein Purlil1_11485 [Purpureocillium lilacinum]|uniref:C2H2-type domain-containing protein n=1 Tax=Purpureocillium lilacinum TaxID=33203 RepID=A0ABR0BJV1_PURLI|nr:hypothetical protein Purlil1_11485 [Purpureocillium lilacinum]